MLHERNTKVKCDLINKDTRLLKQTKSPCKGMKYLASNKLLQYEINMKANVSSVSIRVY